MRGKNKQQISESNEKTKNLFKNPLTKFQEILFRVSYELLKLYRAN